MRYQFEISETDVRRIISAHVSSTLGVEVPPDDVTIEVKSKQNYKSEWEKASFRAIIAGDK